MDKFHPVRQVEHTFMELLGKSLLALLARIHQFVFELIVSFGSGVRVFSTDSQMLKMASIITD